MTATAPGKIFVLGEYAVALGAPAIVAAVDQRVGCRLRVRPGSGRMRIQAGVESHEGLLSGDGVADVPPACRFVAAALRVSARRLNLRNEDVEIETWSDFDGGGAKVGLGGSAAIVAATTAAVHAVVQAEPPAPLRLAALAVAAHRLAQAGGSGADVVAATVGGIQCVGNLDASNVPRSVDEAAGGIPVQAESLRLPDQLVLEVVSTQKAASTGPRVDRFVSRALGRGPLGEGGAAIVRAWSGIMEKAVADFRAACHTPSVAGALAAMAAARRAFERLGPVAGVSVWTPALRQACEASATLPDVSVKPSGAGGGDCAVALLDRRRREELRAAWRARGLQPIDLTTSLRGVEVEAGRGRGQHG